MCYILYHNNFLFQSTLPARGATRFACRFVRKSTFQSTLPARGATFCARASRADSLISIHAPREGSDGTRDSANFRAPNFNPRSPRGERRCRMHPHANSPLHFNPRSPRGERPLILNRCKLIKQFQSTLPARGATLIAFHCLYYIIISIHAPREGSDSNIAQIFTIRTAILQHGYQTRLVFGTKSIVLNRKKSFKLPVFLREPTGLFMFTSGSRHGRSKNQRVGHIYGGACTDVLNLSLI